MRSLSIAVTVALLVSYTSIAFTMWEPYPGDWYIQARGGATFLFFFVTGLIMMTEDDR